MHAASFPIPQRPVSRIVSLALVLIAVTVAALWAMDLRGRLPFSPAPDRDGTTLPGAFLYQQQRSLSCEYASVHIATTMAGHPVSEYEVGALVPLDENPHRGYRGDIHGEWGNTTDYGVYHGPLHEALTELGIESDAFYADGNRAALTDRLNAGQPVVVWLGMWGDTSFNAWPADGTRYQLTPGMHVMVAYGYDATSVYLTDPGTAVWREYPWDAFMAMWNVMDGMGLSVMPA